MRSARGLLQYITDVPMNGFAPRVIQHAQLVRENTLRKPNRLHAQVEELFHVRAQGPLRITVGSEEGSHPMTCAVRQVRVCFL